MPSSIAMTEYDGSYVFDIESYLTSTYPDMTKPDRRAVCHMVCKEIDEEVVEGLIDDVVSLYALDKLGWRPDTEDDDDAD